MVETSVSWLVLGEDELNKSVSERVQLFADRVLAPLIRHAELGPDADDFLEAACRDYRLDRRAIAVHATAVLGAFEHDAEAPASLPAGRRREWNPVARTWVGEELVQRPLVGIGAEIREIGQRASRRRSAAVPAAPRIASAAIASAPSVPAAPAVPPAPALAPLPVGAPAVAAAVPVSVDVFTGDAEFWQTVERRVAMARGRTSEAAQRIVSDLQSALATDDWQLAFGYRCGDPRCVVLDERAAAGAGTLFFVGDTHGDALALEASLAAIDELAPTSTVVFLGDLIDDGAGAHEVLLSVFERLLAEPRRFLVLGGNHDLALCRRQAADGRSVFASGVVPGEFAHWLQERRDEPHWQALGEVTVAFFADMPRAVLFAHGLLAAHGGFPHMDQLAELTDRQALERPTCLDDFVWGRFSTAPKKLPNRNGHGHQFGWKNFEEFADRAATFLGFRLERMVRGHDHVDAEARFENVGGGWAHRVLTINNLSYQLRRDLAAGLPYARQPSLVRWDVSQGVAGLSVVPLAIPSDLVVREHPAAP